MFQLKKLWDKKDKHFKDKKNVQKWKRKELCSDNIVSKMTFC